jgi:hypothetical protein
MPTAAPSTVYRPRHPERSDFYKIFEQHFERFLDCGRLQGAPKPARPSRASWARLMKRILEIDPLLCIRWGSRITRLRLTATPGKLRPGDS